MIMNHYFIFCRFTLWMAILVQTTSVQTEERYLLSRDIHGPRSINPTVLVIPLIFPLSPPWSLHFRFWEKVLILLPLYNSSSNISFANFKSHLCIVLLSHVIDSIGCVLWVNVCVKEKDTKQAVSFTQLMRIQTNK